MKKHAKKINKQIVLLKTHRYIGLISFIILCWLAVSGLFLNHTEELKLSHKVSTNKFLLNLYHIPEATFTKAVKLKGKWLFGINDDLYLEKQKLSAAYTPPFISALSKEDLLLVVTKKELLLFTPEGEYIDSLNSKDDVKNIGLDSAGSVVVRTNTGCLIADQEFTQLSNCTEENQIEWQQSNKIPNELKESFREAYQGSGISLERIILDAHSGRIFGIAGVYFMDAMAVLIVFLGFSGFVIWLSRKIKKYYR